MKTQWMAGIASGLMLSVPMVPSVAQADPSSLTQLFPALVGVPLTPAQQIQLENLSYQTLPQVQQLLTSEQQAQFNTALSQGKGVRVSALLLNLSLTQRLQILNLLQPMRSQIATILTSEQQQQVQRKVQDLQQQGR